MNKQDKQIAESVLVAFPMSRLRIDATLWQDKEKGFLYARSNAYPHYRYVIDQYDQTYGIARAKRDSDGRLIIF